MRRISFLLISFFLIILIDGCGVYSFTGASISPDIKTVSIEYFPNQASLVQPTLSQVFTEKLRDKFVSQTNVTLVKSNGDLRFEGAITDYNSQPTAIQGNEQAALNRLTVTVKVTFTNTKDDKMNFESTFSRYSDYDSKKSLNQVENELINDICNQLADDIFNRAVINW